MVDGRAHVRWRIVASAPPVRPSPCRPPPMDARPYAASGAGRPPPLHRQRMAGVVLAAAATPLPRLLLSPREAGEARAAGMAPTHPMPPSRRTTASRGEAGDATSPDWPEEDSEATRSAGLSVDALTTANKGQGGDKRAATVAESSTRGRRRRSSSRRHGPSCSCSAYRSEVMEPWRSEDVLPLQHCLHDPQNSVDNGKTIGESRKAAVLNGICQ